jgi:cbb3-type cytochrome oxidase maturation protein
MDLIYIILPLALVIATFALVAFIWAARSGQFDDLETPSRRVLLDDVPMKPEPERESSGEDESSEA